MSVRPLITEFSDRLRRPGSRAGPKSSLAVPDLFGTRRWDNVWLRDGTPSLRLGHSELLFVRPRPEIFYRHLKTFYILSFLHFWHLLHKGQLLHLLFHEPLRDHTSSVTRQDQTLYGVSTVWISFLDSFVNSPFTRNKTHSYYQVNPFYLRHDTVPTT